MKRDTNKKTRRRQKRSKQTGGAQIEDIRKINVMRSPIPNSFQYNLSLEWRNGKGTSIMNISQFPIQDDNINKFQSYLNKNITEMDCFLNAMQLIGIFDVFTANMMRITCTGRQGVNNYEIEMAFMLAHGIKMLGEHIPYYDLFAVGNFDIWQEVLTKSLLPGHVVFCGWTDPTLPFNHVFLVGRYMNGDIVYLDPQVVNCKLIDMKCVEALRSRESNQRVYHILYSSIESITSQDILTDMGFDLNQGR